MNHKSLAPQQFYTSKYCLWRKKRGKKDSEKFDKTLISVSRQCLQHELKRRQADDDTLDIIMNLGEYIFHSNPSFAEPSIRADLHKLFSDIAAIPLVIVPAPRMISLFSKASLKGH